MLGKKEKPFGFLSPSVNGCNLPLAFFSSSTIIFYLCSGFYNNMGCVVSRPETNEGGDYKLITRRGSIGKDSEISESIILDPELSTHSKRSKTGGEKACKEEEDERQNAQEEKGDEQKLSPSPSFRIYCVFPRDPNDGS